MREDIISVRGLLLRTVIGVNPEERRGPQNVILHLWLYTDTRAAAASDDLSDTVDYSAVVDDITAFVQGNEFWLIERLAAAVAQRCLRLTGVNRVRVRVEKPDALRLADRVALEIERQAGEDLGLPGD